MNEINTSAGVQISAALVNNYFRSLVNRFFKILPMRENNELTLAIYMHSLQMELFGYKSLVPAFGDNSLFLTLLSILQYLIITPECPVPDVKREVFRAIGICNKLSALYAEREAIP